MGHPDQRAAAAWKQRQQTNTGIPESATERHHREWAEGLVKYPQGRAPEGEDMPPRAPVRPSAPWYRGYDEIAPKEGE